MRQPDITNLTGQAGSDYAFVPFGSATCSKEARALLWLLAGAPHKIVDADTTFQSHFPDAMLPSQRSGRDDAEQATAFEFVPGKREFWTRKMREESLGAMVDLWVNLWPTFLVDIWRFPAMWVQQELVDGKSHL